MYAYHCARYLARITSNTTRPTSAKEMNSWSTHHFAGRQQPAVRCTGTPWRLEADKTPVSLPWLTITHKLSTDTRAHVSELLASRRRTDLSARLGRSVATSPHSRRQIIVRQQTISYATRRHTIVRYFVY